MVDILPVLITATKTLQLRLENWFSDYPAGQPWSVVSDYCIGADNKNNDAFSFVIIANHDTAANISEYIAAVAPRDIKNVRTVPHGLVQYLTCPSPVAFSVSFVIDKRSALLRDYLRVEDMAEFIPDVRGLMESMRNGSQPSEHVDPTYFEEALKRLELFAADLARKQLNAKLCRQIHLAAAFTATVFHLVTKATGAGLVRWISDRDALIERHDTVVYDLAYIYYLLHESNVPGLQPDAQGVLKLNIPRIRFEIPEKTGKHRFDDLIRLPDYLAGTLADVNMVAMDTSHEKFEAMLRDVFINSPNNGIVQLLSTGDKITARTVQFLKQTR